MRIRVRVTGYVKGDGTSQATVAHFRPFELYSGAQKLIIHGFDSSTFLSTSTRI